MQNESPIIQSIRINPSDKETFAEISKQLGIPHHESFGKMVTLFKKMYELEDQAPNRLAQAKEVTVLFDRLIHIYEDVLSSNDTLKEQMIENHSKILSDKEKHIHHLSEESMKYQEALKEKEASLNDKELYIQDLEKRIKALESHIDKNEQLENYKETLIENLQSENKFLQESIEQLNEHTQQQALLFKPYNLSAEQLLTQYDALLENKTMYIQAVEQMKKELKESFDSNTSLQLQMKGIQIQNETLLQEKVLLTQQNEQQKQEHLLEKDQIKSEYKSIYENQIQFMKDTYDQNLKSILSNTKTEDIPNDDQKKL